MTAAVLSLGSNVGDRTAALAAAVRSLGPAVRAVSAVYRTPPWGPVPQQDFHNAVVLTDDEHADAAGWLARCRQLEAHAGRTRDVRWGPRTLDVDVITVTGPDGPVIGDVLAPGELLLPHPLAYRRAFVLLPWTDIDPTAELPGRGPIKALLDALPDGEVDAITRVASIGWSHG